MNGYNFSMPFKKGTEIAQTFRRSANAETMISNHCRNLIPSRNAKVEELIYPYQNIFASGKGLTGKTNKISIGDGQPMRQRPRKAKQEEAVKHIKDMASKVDIEPLNIIIRRLCKEKGSIAFWTPLLNGFPSWI